MDPPIDQSQQQKDEENELEDYTDVFEPAQDNEDEDEEEIITEYTPLGFHAGLPSFWQEKTTSNGRGGPGLDLAGPQASERVFRWFGSGLTWKVF